MIDIFRITVDSWGLPWIFGLGAVKTLYCGTGGGVYCRFVYFAYEILGVLDPTWGPRRVGWGGGVEGVLIAGTTVVCLRAPPF